MPVINNNRSIYKKALILIIFTAFVLIDCLMPQNSLALIGMKEGDTPKQIVLNDMNGKQTDISAFFGKKPVVLVFWELPLNKSFLDYSLDELNFLKEYYKEYNKKSGLEIFAIYTPVEENNIPEKELSAVQSLITTNKIKYPVLVDTDFKYFREYGIIALPSTIIINKEGKIQYIYPSFPMAGRPIISTEIKKLVGIAPPAIKEENGSSKVHDSKANKLYRYALQMYKKGLLEQSLSPLKKSMNIDRDNSWAHNLFGIILWERGNIEQSESEFRNAIKSDNNLAARLNYAVLLIEKGHYEKAEEILLNSPLSHSHFKMIGHYLLGFIYKTTGRTDLAIKELEYSYNIIEEEAYSIDKSTPRALSFKITILHDLSKLYSNNGNDKKALELIFEAFQYMRVQEGDQFAEGLRRINHLMIYE